jgi:hypothetical protein
VCVALAFAAPALVGALAGLIDELCAVPGSAAPVRGALEPLVTFYLGLSGLIVIGGFLFARRSRTAVTGETWGCGYTAPGARIQYTASSLSESLVSQLLPGWLRPRSSSSPPRGIFPDAISWSELHQDPLTREIYEPVLIGSGDRFSRLRWLQQGSLHLYLVYIALIAVLGLVWAAVQGWWTA